MRPPPPPSPRALRALLAAIPIAAMTIGVPFVNHVEPRIVGLPFNLAWIVAWVILTPVFVWSIGRLDGSW